MKAVLIFENTNRYDPDAVKVEIKGQQVGYLSRGDAKAFRKRMAAERIAGERFDCEANIRGGWERSSGSGPFGVYLDVGLYD